MSMFRHPLCPGLGPVLKSPTRARVALTFRSTLSMFCALALRTAVSCLWPSCSSVSTATRPLSSSNDTLILRELWLECRCCLSKDSLGCTVVHRLVPLLLGQSPDRTRSSGFFSLRGRESPLTIPILRSLLPSNSVLSHPLKCNHGAKKERPVTHRRDCWDLAKISRRFCEHHQKLRALLAQSSTCLRRNAPRLTSVTAV